MFGIFSDIRPHERASALGALTTLGAILAAHQLLETARDALFLAKLEATQLPFVYLGIALLGFLVVALGQGRGGTRRILSATLLIAAAIATGFWVALGTGETWVVYALYLSTGVFSTVAVTSFWSVLATLHTSKDAKRIFAFVGTGGILGAVVGSALARVLTEVYAPRHLVLAAAVVMVLTGLTPMAIRWVHTGPVRAPAKIRRPLRESLHDVGLHPYPRRVLALAVLASVALTVVDYAFKSVVDERVAPEALGVFFATVGVVLNTASLVMQLVVVRWVLRRFGLATAVVILPVLLSLGAIAVAVGGGLIAAVGLKSVDGSLRHSLHRTASELLFVPMSDNMRGAAKVLADVVGTRGGQAVASLAILGLVSLIGHSITAVATVAVVLLGAWVAVAWGIRGLYLDLFRRTLRQQSIRTQLDVPELDLMSLEALLEGLNSNDDDVVLATLEVLDDEGKAHLIPDLILYHPSKRVVLRALEIFAARGRTGFARIADRLLKRDDPDIRVAALLAREAVEPDPQRLSSLLEDEAPVVRAAASVRLALARGAVDAELEAEFRRVARDGPREAQLAFARALAGTGDPMFVDALCELATAESADVRQLVAVAMSGAPDPRFVPPLLSMLEHQQVRGAARDALVALGSPALQALDEALGDPDLAAPVRSHVPRTISRFEPKAAAAVLQRHINAGYDDVVSFKILRGLGRLKANNPRLPIDGGVLRKARDRALRSAFRALHWRVTLQRGWAEDDERETPVADMLVGILTDVQGDAVQRVLRLSGLQHPRENFEIIHRGLGSTQRRVRSSSQEMLEALLEGPVQRSLLALVDDDLDPTEQLEAASPYYEVEDLTYATALGAILDDGRPVLQAVAAHHVGELGLRELEPRLVQLAADTDPAAAAVAEVSRRALQELQNPSDDRLAYAE